MKNTKVKPIPAILDKITTLKDGGTKTTFDTQELDDEEISYLFSLRNKMGWLYFVADQVDELEIPEDPPAEFKEDKTPSQRLRAVMYILWNQLGRHGDFTDFYRIRMNKIIEEVKDKLN